MVKRTREAAHSGEAAQRPAGPKQASDGGQKGDSRQGKKPSVNKRRWSREASSPPRRGRNVEEECEDEENPIEGGSREEGPDARSGQAGKGTRRAGPSASKGRKSAREKAREVNGEEVEERDGAREAHGEAEEDRRGRPKRRRNPAPRKKEQPPRLSLFEKAVLKIINKKHSGKRAISADALFAITAIMNDFLDHNLKRTELLTHYKGGSQKKHYVCTVDDISKALRLSLSRLHADFFIQKGHSAVTRAREAKLEKRKRREEDLISQGIYGEELASAMKLNELDRYEVDVSSNDDVCGDEPPQSDADSKASSSSEILPFMPPNINEESYILSRGRRTRKKTNSVPPNANGEKKLDEGGNASQPKKTRRRTGGDASLSSPGPDDKKGPFPSPAHTTGGAPSQPKRPRRQGGGGASLSSPGPDLAATNHPKRPMMERPSSGTSSQISSNSRVGLDEAKRRQISSGGRVDDKKKKEKNTESTARRSKQDEADDLPHPSEPKSRALDSTKKKGRPMEAKGKNKPSGKSGA